MDTHLLGAHLLDIILLPPPPIPHPTPPQPHVLGGWGEGDGAGGHGMVWGGAQGGVQGEVGY